MEQLIYDIFLFKLSQILKFYSLFYYCLDMSCQFFILKILDWPKTKVHAVKYKQLQQSSLGLLLCFMANILIELLIAELLGKPFQVLLVDFYMLCPLIDVAASFTNQFALVGHKRNQFITQLNQNYLMNLKKTQEFVYFQNKARHYANLRSMKPAVKTHRDRYNSSTIDQYSRVPYFKRYDMQRENEGLINRITDILSSQKTQIQKHGYTRYNHAFVPKSHLTIEQRKAQVQIDEENHLLANKVLKSRPSIGTIQNWNNHFYQIKERKKNISKFTDKRTSKGTLVLNSSTNFIPEHYKSFFNHSLPKREMQQQPESPQQMGLGMKIKIQQLFQLPKLKKMRGSLTKIVQNDKMFA